MAFIYKITNDINNKVYIGKTQQSLERRFKQHCRDCYRQRMEQRPLYAAMNKYGTDHFKIELIEETDYPDEREQYWIKQYDSYGRFGYNATIGGDGKRRVDYDLIYSLWNEGLNEREISKKINCNEGTVRTALQQFKIPKNEIEERRRLRQSKQVLMIDKDTDEPIKSFTSVTDALNFLGKKNGGHISAACQGKYKTAYGYKWKYL